MNSQAILTEYPTGLQFLNQHGNISLFADGFTAMEHKYLKYLLLRIYVNYEFVADIEVKFISKKDLHKVFLYELSTILSLKTSNYLEFASFLLLPAYFHM